MAFAAAEHALTRSSRSSSLGHLLDGVPIRQSTLTAPIGSRGRQCSAHPTCIHPGGFWYEFVRHCPLRIAVLSPPFAAYSYNLRNVHV